MDVASVVWVWGRGLPKSHRESDASEMPRQVCLTSGLGSLQELSDHVLSVSQRELSSSWAVVAHTFNPSI